MSSKKIAIIGGGCCGLLLANLLKDTGLNITIFEKNNKIGKKILASGNGKCNFTNLSDCQSKYNCEFANNIINKYDSLKTIRFMEESLGLVSKSDEEGRCYPISECSSSVLDCLKINLKNVRIVLDSVVKNIENSKGKYKVILENKEECFDFVVCCSGSAASNLGNMKAYEYLHNMEINITELKPSLVPLKVKENVESLKGVRVKCMVKLLDGDNKVVNEEYGEVMFKEDGLSGIAVFNASSYMNRKKDRYKIALDLSNGLGKNNLLAYIKAKKDLYPNVFTGFLNEKLANYIMSKVSDKYSEQSVEHIVDLILNLDFNVTGTYSLFDSQVCSGGVSLEEVDDNLELKKYPNVFVGGELLDVDGVCGGYNMQFAWSSAGVIAQIIKDRLEVSESEKNK